MHVLFSYLVCGVPEEGMPFIPQSAVIAADQPIDNETIFTNFSAVFQPLDRPLNPRPRDLAYLKNNLLHVTKSCATSHVLDHTVFFNSGGMDDLTTPSEISELSFEIYDDTFPGKDGCE